MIFCCADTGVFATAPALKHWIHAGLMYCYNPPPDRREEMLQNATTEFIRHVAIRSFIKERSKVGIVAMAKARDVQIVPPRNFELSSVREPALFWLFDHSNTARQAVKVLTYLIEKNKLGELSQSERDAIGTKLMTKGESTKNVATNGLFPTNVWRQRP